MVAKGYRDMIGSYLVDTAYRVRPTINRYGEVGSTSVTRLSAKVDWATKLVTDSGGNRVVAQATVLISYDAVIQPADKLRVDGVDYPIIGTHKRKDFAGRFTEVYI